MTKTLVATCILSVIGLSAYAQSSRSDGLKNELSAEVEKLYQQTEKPANTQVASLPAKTTQSAPVVVVHQPAPQPTYVEKRPTAYVDSSPLDESRASRMRKRREAMEAETEMKIVEKLETDRMESEKERASRIFGDKWERHPEQVKPQPAVAPVQPQVIMVSPAEKEFEKEDLKQDIREVVSELKAEEKAQSNYRHEDNLFDAADSYIKVSGGANFYRGVNNIKGGYHVTAAYGWDYTSGLAFDFGLGLSKFDLYDCGSGGGSCGVYGGNIKEVTQTSLNFMINYRFESINSRIKPVVGAVSSAVFRDYQNKATSGIGGDIQSMALDLGVLGGAEIRLSRNLSVTTDLRYMMNVLKDVNSDSYTTFGIYNNPYSTDVEELNYFNLAIGLKYLF